MSAVVSPFPVWKERLITGTNSQTGTISASSYVDVMLDAYCFYHCVRAQVGGASDVRMAATGSATGDADTPQFMLKNTVASTRTYDVDWRYVTS